MNYKIKLGMFITIILLALVPFVNGLEIPKSIDGTIYSSKGIEVSEGTPFKIINFDKNIVLDAETGVGSSGRYSYILEGDIGDLISVVVLNSGNEISRNITLQGVIHNFDLILDGQISNLPDPKIVQMKLPFSVIGKLNKKANLTFVNNETEEQFTAEILKIGNNLRYQVTINSIKAPSLEIYLDGKKIGEITEVNFDNNIATFDINNSSSLIYIFLTLFVIIILGVIVYLMRGKKR